MAYNGYGSYTPYHQSQQPNSNDRSQYAPQNSSAAYNSAYQGQANTTPNSSNSNQQQPQTAYGSSTRYPRSEESTTGYQSSYIPSFRGAGDTTALGSLAYASTLRQGNGDSIQGVADFNRQQVGYGQSQNDGQNYKRSESRGPVGSRVTCSINSPNVPAQSYPHQIAHGSGNYGSYQSQPPRHNDGRRSSQQTSAPSRPASGQSMHGSHSNRQMTPSSQLHGYTPTEPVSTRNQPSINYVAATQISRPPSAQHLHSRIGPSMPNRAAAASPNVMDNSHYQRTAPVHQRSTDRSQSTKLPSISNVTNTQAAEIATGATPTTVDPNQVFNQYEYQKRQAAVAAEAEAARRKADEAEKSRKRAEASKQSRTVEGRINVNGIDNEVKKKEQMEAEMKLLLEKMREYKSKDPALFSQIWEQVKKAQPPGSSKDTTQTTTDLPASKEVALPSPIAPVDTNNLQSSTMPVVSNASLSSPQVWAEEMPDRGKFPAARRGRPGTGRQSRGGRKSVPTTTHEAPNGTISAPNGSTNAHAIPQTNDSLAPGTLDVNAHHATNDAPTSTSKQSTDDAPTPNSSQPVQKIWVSGRKPNPLPRNSTYQPEPEPLPAPEAVMSTSATTTQPSNSASLRPSGQTVWPEEDKWTLAIAARDTLMLNPVNSGKSISSSQIHAILNQGPSYEELCRLLEAKGFVVDRTPFAQRLLSVVPRLKDGQRPQRPAPAISSTTQPAPQIAPAPPSPSSAPRPPSVSDHQPSKRPVGTATKNLAPTAPMFGTLQPVVLGWKPVQTVPVPQQPSKMYSSSFQPLPQPPPQPPSQPHVAMINGNVASNMQQPALDSPPSAISKEKAARKRNFAEIVDLTAEMSSDEELNRQRAEEMKKLEQLKRMQQVKAAMDASITTKVTEPASDQVASTPKPKNTRFSPGIGLSSSAPSDDEVSGLARFRNNATTQRDRIRKSREIVKPLKRTDAMRRSTYNSKTIARDILVTAGKHPSMSALNYHLDPLRSHFRHVEYSSNLSTFDWGLVDPGGPPVRPRHEERSMNEKNNDADDADDEVDESVDTRARPNQRRQGQVAVSENGTHDTVMADASSPGLKGFPRMSGRGRGPRPSRGGIRPRAAIRSSGQHQSQSLAQTPRSADRGDVSILGAGVPTSAVVAASRLQRSPPSSNHQFANQSSQASQASARTSEKKRGGRSKKNNNQPPTTPRLDSNAPTPILKLSHFRSNSTTPSKPSKTSGMPDSKVTRLANERTATTPARPSGLRNQVLTSPFAVVIPQQSPNVESGSPVPSTQSQKVKQSSPPKYQIYKCRWKGCEGRLHNLETLRKHVHKHKEEFDEVLKCLWEGCGTTKIIGSSSTESGSRQPLEFKSETAWEYHMEGRHLDRYAWELGDGPSTHASDAEASDYLSDGQKRQVTPIASPDNPRSDTFNLATVPRSERAKVAQAFHGAHENKTEVRKAKAVFDNLVERRRKLGPGIERGGHQFVTDEKRALLEAGPEQLSKVDSADL